MTIAPKRDEAATIAGIDEAGYGPLLGPLVVTGVSLAVADGDVKQCLWKRLEAAITRRPSRQDSRVVITDSKVLYRRAEGVKALERTALVMCRVAGVEAGSFRELLTSLAPDALTALDVHPWYRGFDLRLPVENDAEALALRAAVASRLLEQAGVRLRGVHSEVLPEAGFNELVHRTRNKATVSLGLVLRLADRVARDAPARLRVCIDRQGGRQRYRAILHDAFDPQELRILAETERLSSYVLHRRRGPQQMDFIVDGEQAELPIALASIVSKYVRELCMRAFNAYWAARVDGLLPTAGYYQDGLRFLRDIEPARLREAVDRSMLVRVR